MDSEVTNVAFKPTPEESTAQTALYKDIAFMRALKTTPMSHFANGPDGPRSWLQMLDDSEAILNMYTPTREDQGKEEWQSNANVGGAEVRAKMRAVAAGVGLKVPDMYFEATNQDGIKASKPAEIFKNIVQSSYNQKNPTLAAFLEVWHLLSHGVIFEYEGYKTGGAKQEVVDSFDTITGEVQTRTEYVKMEGQPINVIVNPQEFFWKTFFVRDIQAQPTVAWIQNYTKREFELEFSKYPNFKFVKDKAQAKELALNDTTYFKAWSERVQEHNDYEVIRRYSKDDDGGTGSLKGYEVWVNGVPMLRCPLLWGDKEKRYPFAHEVPEYFANTNFFVGLPFPIVMEGYADNKNLLLNSLVDKVARGLDPVKLVSLGNRDLLDVEAEIQQGSDSTIYVPDIAGVRFMEHPPVNQGEIVLLNMVNQGMALISVDASQQGVTSAGPEKSAREAVIADQRAEELKGPIYTALEDLWYQKTKLRNSVILSHYLKDKAAAETIKGQIISIKDYTFADGARGTLDIHVAKTPAKLLSEHEIDAREQAMQNDGKAYKLVSMLVSYLDDWEFDYRIVPGSFHKRDRIAQEDEIMGELDIVTKLFPEFFVANKNKYLADVLEMRGHHLDEYNPPAPPAPVAPAGAPPGQPSAPIPASPSTPPAPAAPSVLGLQ